MTIFTCPTIFTCAHVGVINVCAFTMVTVYTLTVVDHRPTIISCVSMTTRAVICSVYCCTLAMFTWSIDTQIQRCVTMFTHISVLALTQIIPKRFNAGSMDTRVWIAKLLLVVAVLTYIVFITLTCVIVA